MTNPVVANNDTTQLQVFDPKYQQEVVNFTEAQTHAKGEILGRKQISDTVAAAYSGTGNGTCTNQALGVGGPAKVGAYNLACVEKITNSGRFKLEDPDGLLLTNQIVIPVSGSIHFEAFGLQFDLADGGTDFEVADAFTLTTTVDGTLKTYDSAGVDGTEVPYALMTRARTAAAGDYAERVLIEGEVDRAMVETAYGAALPNALKDALAAIGIIVRAAVALDELDNS